MERFMRIGTVIGCRGAAVRKKEEARSLVSELEHGAVALDNLLYEEFGMSGEDITRVLFS